MAPHILLNHNKAAKMTAVVIKSIIRIFLGFIKWQKFWILEVAVWNFVLRAIKLTLKNMV